ncbi:MAG: class I SAM-dependent methyltransferase [bacterium]
MKKTMRETMKEAVQETRQETMKKTMSDPMEATPITQVVNYLQCPQTASELSIRGNHLENLRGDTYPVSDGIIDFIGDDGQTVDDSYDEISEEKYNNWVRSKFIMRLVWGVNLDKIPKIKDEVSGFTRDVLLDIPCGTGIMSVEAYKALPDSIFLAIDYSRSMLDITRRLCKRLKIGNVVFIRADVASLPIKDNTVSACISLNGFHAFASPRIAAKELGRCTRKRGKLLMVVSCTGERFISDFMIKHFMIPRGYFHNALPSSHYEEYLHMAGFSEISSEMMGASMIARCYK